MKGIDKLLVGKLAEHKSYFYGAGGPEQPAMDPLPPSVAVAAATDGAGRGGSGRGRGGAAGANPLNIAAVAADPAAAVTAAAAAPADYRGGGGRGRGGRISEAAIYASDM